MQFILLFKSSLCTRASAARNETILSPNNSDDLFSFSSVLSFFYGPQPTNVFCQSIQSEGSDMFVQSLSYSIVNIYFIDYSKGLCTLYIVQCTVNVHSVDTFYIYTKARLNSVTIKKNNWKESIKNWRNYHSSNKIFTLWNMYFTLNKISLRCFSNIFLKAQKLSRL